MQCFQQKVHFTQRGENNKKLYMISILTLFLTSNNVRTVIIEIRTSNFAALGRIFIWVYCSSNIKDVFGGTAWWYGSRRFKEYHTWSPILKRAYNGSQLQRSNQREQRLIHCIIHQSTALDYYTNFTKWMIISLFFLELRGILYIVRTLFAVTNR